MNFTEYTRLDADFREAIERYAKEIYGGEPERKDGCYTLAQKYLDAMKEKAQGNEDFRNLAGSYLRGEGMTLLLKDILYSLESYDSDKVLNQHNGLAYIDSVSYHFDRATGTFIERG